MRRERKEDGMENKCDNKFWEDLMASFPFQRRRLHKKQKIKVIHLNRDAAMHTARTEEH
jgi:hypothetical protein